jgi:formylglycine-generating enzyme required for sulfatase activity
MKTIFKKSVTLLLVLFLCSKIFANGITISNLTVLPATSQVQFDVTWENSWRSDVMQNWDAAYVFLKWKYIDGTSQTLNLSILNSVIPSGFSATVVSGGTAVLLYRSIAGSGTSTLTGVRLGILPLVASGVWDIKAFGIEMVNIPEGAFFLGDAGGSANYYRSYSVTPTLAPYFVTSNDLSLTDPLSSPTTINTSNNFPTGYNNFYCMKYEISQGGYRDFLNSLTYAQQVNHTANLPTSAVGTNALTNIAVSRPFIEIATPGLVVASPATNIPAVYGCDGNNNNVFNEAGDGEWIACNYMNWPDLAAYLVWAGMVPMTETQFEKICRGPVQPVTSEQVWGTTQVAGNQYTLTNAGFANEVINNVNTGIGIGNANYSGTYQANGNGPYRNGIFATATSNRVSSGAGYYGVMELGGNLFERVVTTANAKGLTYKAVNGSNYAYLNEQGFAYGNVYSDNWPGVNTSTGAIDGTVNAQGLMYRGGYYNSSGQEITTSYRFNVVSNSSLETFRSGILGGRGVVGFP